MVLPLFVSTAADAASSEVKEARRQLEKGKGYYELEWYEKSEVELTGLLNGFPESALARLYLASAQYHTGALDLSRKNALIVYFTTDKQEVMYTAQLLLGCIAASEGKYSTALYHFHDLLHKAPGLDEALYNYALCCFNLGEFALAAELFENYYLLHPESKETAAKLAKAQAALSEIEVSRYFQQMSTNQEQHLLPLQRKLQWLLLHADLREALPLVKKILTLCNKDPQATFAAFWLHWKYGAQERAAEISHFLLHSAPQHPLSHLSRCLLQLQWMEEESDSFRQSLQFLRTRANPHTEGLAKYLEGRFFLKKGQFEQARRCFAQSLTLAPRLWDAAFLMGWSYGLQGKWREAMEVWKPSINCDDAEPVSF